MLEVDLVHEMRVPDLGTPELGIVEADPVGEVGLEEGRLLHPAVEHANVRLEARLLDLLVSEERFLKDCVGVVGTSFGGEVDADDVFVLSAFVLMVEHLLFITSFACQEAVVAGHAHISLKNPN